MAMQPHTELRVVKVTHQEPIHLDLVVVVYLEMVEMLVLTLVVMNQKMLE